MIQQHWPLHPKPVEGEALSSWLSRVAAIYNLLLEDLLKYDLGYEISPTDLDLNPPTELLKNIEHRSKLNLDQLYHMTFKSCVPFIIDHLDPSLNIFETYISQYPVLLPIKTRPSYMVRNWWPWLSNSSTMKACENCIKANPKNVIHLSWKLPIMISCPLHGCRLKPCTNYSSEYVHWEEDTIDRPVTQATLTMDTRTWEALITGKVDLPRCSIHAGVWFRLLRTLINELSLPLSRYPARASYIQHIWNTCGHPFRAGLTIWKPYEFLPSQMQMKMLEAAGAAMAMIESKSLNISGKYAKLFHPEFIDEDDWPSGPETENNKESPGLSIGELFDQVVAEAKVNRESALGLRALYLFGRKDPELIKEVDAIFLKLGIPFKFT